MNSNRFFIGVQVQVQKNDFFEFAVVLNPICTVGGQICPPLSYFNIAPKLKKSFALMHPDFESNLLTHIFRNFGVCSTTESDIIFVFARSFMQF